MNSDFRFIRQDLHVSALILTIGLATTVVLGGCDDGKGTPPRANPQAAQSNFPVTEPALSNAVILNDIAEIQKIIDAGSEVNTKDALDRTPLHLAAFYGHAKIIDLLIDHGAEVDVKDHTGLTPLLAAVISGGRQSVKALLEHGADIQLANREGQTALHLAAATGQPRMTRLLIERGADVQKKDADGKTPLDYARKNFHPQTATVLEQAVKKTSNNTSAPSTDTKNR